MNPRNLIDGLDFESNFNKANTRRFKLYLDVIDSKFVFNLQELYTRFVESPNSIWQEFKGSFTVDELRFFESMTDEDVETFYKECLSNDSVYRNIHEIVSMTEAESVNELTGEKTIKLTITLNVLEFGTNPKVELNLKSVHPDKDFVFKENQLLKEKIQSLQSCLDIQTKRWILKNESE